MKATTEDVEVIMEMIKPVAFLVQQLPVEALDALIKEAESYDTLGPIFDPTGWNKNHRNVADNLKLLRAVRTFRRSLDELRKRVSPQ